MEKTFTSLCVDSEKPKRRCLEETEISVTWQDGKQYMIYFPTKLSSSIRGNNLPFVDMRKDDLTDEVDLVVNRHSGLRLQVIKGAVRMNSKKAVARLYNALGLTEGKSYILKISKNLSRRDGYLVFRILMQPEPEGSQRLLFNISEE